MAILTVQSIVKTGLIDALVAAAGGGDSFQNTGNEFLDVNNASVGSINVTVAAQKACADYGVSNAAHDIVVAVGAGVRKKIGPFDPKVYNDANGRVQITYSDVTTLTVNPFAMGRA